MEDIRLTYIEKDRMVMNLEERQINLVKEGDSWIGRQFTENNLAYLVKDTSLENAIRSMVLICRS